MVGWLRYCAEQIPHVYVSEANIEEWAGYNPVADMEPRGYLVSVGYPMFPFRIAFFGRSKTRPRFWYVFTSPTRDDTLLAVLGKEHVEGRWFECAVMPETISRVRLSLFLKVLRYRTLGGILPEGNWFSREERRAWRRARSFIQSRFEF